VRGEAEFQYLVLRVIPSLARGEMINAGVVVYCPARDYLGARVGLDRERLSALPSEGVDPDQVAASLEGLRRIAEGDPQAGPLARMPAAERFGWLAAPASTSIQASPAHTGFTDDPAATLDRLYKVLVAG